MDENEWISYECSDEGTPVNCNNTGTLTADKHAHTSELNLFTAHTCLKPRWRFLPEAKMALLASSASNKLTFKRTGESFEEREIQSKVCF
jgi:hypothetical protein